MHTSIFRRLGLCEEAGETAIPTSGGTSTPPPAGTAAGTPPPAAAAAGTTVEPPKLGPIERAKILMKDKGALGQEIATLRSQVSQLTTERDGLRGQVTTLTTENATFKAQLKDLEDSLNVEVGKNTTVQTEVAHQLASQGVPDAQLPKQGAPATTAPDIDAQITAINEKIEKSTDPAEIGRLSQQAWDLMMKKSGQKDN